MTKVIFKDIDNRVVKVSFTKLLRNEGGFTLDVAKHTTDALLKFGEVCIEVESGELARVLIEKAELLGVVSEIIRS